MYETCREFGVLEYVVTSITRGVYISNSQWKKKLKCVICNRERAATSVMYKNIQLYKKCVAVGNIWRGGILQSTTQIMSNIVE